MIIPAHPHLSLTRQCALLGISWSSLYYWPANDNTADLALMAKPTGSSPRRRSTSSGR